MNLDVRLEAILFVAARVLTFKKLSELTGASSDEVKESIEVLARRLKEQEGALQLVIQAGEVELVTRSEVAQDVRVMAQEEAQGEMTRPSLEALAILAYRGPMTRPELEQIRGVQSALILRNLMLRGLVEMKEDTRLGQPLYSVTIDFLKTLGADRLEDLPDFATLHSHPVVEKALQELEPSASETPGNDSVLSV